MKKRGLVLFLVMVLAVSAVACTKEKKEPEEPAEKEPERTYSAIMVSDSGSIEDKSFNAIAWAGFEKASVELGVEIKLLECDNEDDYLPSLTAAADEQPDLIVAAGYAMKDAVKTVAEQYPDQKIALIDGKVDESNVINLTFKEQEGAFLVGAAAAMTTQTKTVGFVGGTQTAEIEKFQFGYQAGVKAIDPNIRVLTDYTGSFNDPVSGKEIALRQHQNGADVVFHASGASGIGVIGAAGEQGFWAIGVDRDQSEINPEAVLCSMIKHLDRAVYATIESVVKDQFQNRTVVYGLKEEGVGYSDDAGNLPEAVKTKIDEYANKITDGTLKVPYDNDGFDTFTVPTE